MSKNKSTGKIIGVIAGVLAFAVIATGVAMAFLLKPYFEPTDFDYTAPVTGEGTGYYRYCYNELNDTEKKVYSVIMQSVHTQPERIEIPELGDGDLTKVFEAISYDNPDLFNLGLNCKVYTEGVKTYFEAEYTLSKEEYTQKLKEAKDIASVIIDGASVYTSVYEKEKYVHDYIINHCKYAEPSESPLANTMYGCLVEGKAACEGYSRAFQYIMSALNIDNRVVTGESADDGVNYVSHMWNYIVLDGEGYFVDLTWDDPKGDGDVLRHTYFNVTTNDILIKYRNIRQQLPLCTATKYNYFVYENAYFTTGTGEEFESAVHNAVYTSMQKQYKCVELRFSDAAILAQAKETLFNSGVVYTVFDEIGLISETDGAKVYYSSDDKMNTMSIFF